MDLFRAIEAVLGGKTFVSDGLEFGKSADGQISHYHEILLCSTEDTLLNAVVRFFTSALNAGNPAIGVLTREHREGLFLELRANNVNIDAAVQKGTFISLDAHGTLSPTDAFDAINSARAAAVKEGRDDPRVAFCGERAGLSWAEGNTDEAIRVEQFASTLAKRHKIDILCVYHVRHGKEEDQALKSICAEHTAVYSR
jgi:hypothetical protein